MKKRIIIYLIIVLMLNGCNYNSHKIDNNQELNNNINHLINDKVAELYIKQGDGNFYRTTDSFRNRIVEKLSNYRITKSNEKFDFDCNLTFKFNGYKQLFFNTERNYFRFEDSDRVYEVQELNKEFWDRHILKEINGEIMYYSFERDIIQQMPFMDLDEDDSFDDIILYYDGDIRLKVKDHDVCVIPDIEPDIIESKLLSNNLESYLYIKENKDSNTYMFMVGSTYSFVNKIGSLSWFKCYLYKENQLIEIWDSDDISSSEIVVKDLKEDVLTLFIKNINTTIDIKLTIDEKIRLEEYVEFLKKNNEKIIGMEDFEFFSGMTQYIFYDYNEDEKDELIIDLYMRGGAAGITRDIIIIYDVTEQGIELMDVILGRENEKIMEAFDKI